MKRIITILTLVLVITLAGCGGAPASVPDTAPAPEPAQEPILAPEPVEPVQEPVIEEPEPVPSLTPATFTIHDLSISPSEIDAGEEITITVHISNIGDEAGECAVRLQMDNTPLKAFHVSLDGGFSEKITIACKVDFPPGTYSVDADGLLGTFAGGGVSDTFTVRGKPLPIVVTGSGDKTSRPFTIATDEWVIDWSYVPDPEYSDIGVVFSVFVYPRGETAVYVESVLFPESTSGSTYSYAGAGQYYIKVVAGGVKSWEVVISPQ